jgi:hypothetical protein
MKVTGGKSPLPSFAEGSITSPSPTGTTRCYAILQYFPAIAPQLLQVLPQDGSPTFATPVLGGRELLFLLLFSLFPFPLSLSFQLHLHRILDRVQRGAECSSGEMQASTAGQSGVAAGAGGSSSSNTGKKGNSSNGGNSNSSKKTAGKGANAANNNNNTAPGEGGEGEEEKKKR